MEQNSANALNPVRTVAPADGDFCPRRLDDARRQAWSLAIALLGLLAGTTALLAGAALSLVWH